MTILNIKQEMEKEMSDLKKENGMDILEAKYQRRISAILKEHEKDKEHIRLQAQTDLNMADEAHELRVSEIITTHFEKQIEIKKGYQEIFIRIILWL